MVQSNRSDGGDAPGDSPGTGDFDLGWRELLVDHLDLPRVDAESPAKTELRRATRAVHVRQQASSMRWCANGATLSTTATSWQPRTTRYYRPPRRLRVYGLWHTIVRSHAEPAAHNPSAF